MSVINLAFALTLDEDAIRAEANLSQWADTLHLDKRVIVTPTWEHVFEEIGRIIVGAPQYYLYCRTAMGDLQRFTKLAVTNTVSQGIDRPAPARKVSATPPPPATVKKAPPPAPAKV